jgi:hypothetical protein
VRSPPAASSRIVCWTFSRPVRHIDSGWSRIAAIGDSTAARPAGMTHAASATTASVIVVPANVVISDGVTP